MNQGGNQIIQKEDKKSIRTDKEERGRGKL